MARGTYATLCRRVGDYLLLAAVGTLVLEAAAGVSTPVPAFRLTVVVAVAFGALAVVRVVAPGVVDRPDATPTSRTLTRKRGLALLVALLCVGAVLRGHALGAQSFWFDEAITTNAATAVLERGRPVFPSGYVYWRAFPHTLVVAGSMALLGPTEAAARLPSVVFGVAAIGATYWLGRSVDGPAVGLVAAALATFATWEIAWSRQARMYQLFQLLYVLAAVLLLRVDREGVGDVRSVGALVAVVGLAASVHKIGYVLVPVAVAFLGLAVVADRRDASLTDWHDASLAVVGLVLGSLAVLLGLELAGVGARDLVSSIVTTDVGYLDAYVAWLTAELGAFALLALIGATLTFARGSCRAGAVLLLATVPALWTLSVHVELFATRYLYAGFPILLVWAAVTVAYAADVAVERGRALRRWIRNSRLRDVRPRADGGSTLSSLAVTVAFVALLALGGGFTATPRAEYDLGTNAPQPDFASAYEHVTERRDPGDVVVAGWTAPGLYYAGEVDYWLAHDLTGSENHEQWVYEGTDRYAGADPVETADELGSVIRSNREGWIVLDGVALSRQDAETRRLLRSLSRRQFDGITVYHWANATDGTAGSERMAGTERSSRVERSVGAERSSTPDEGTVAGETQ